MREKMELGTWPHVWGPRLELNLCSLQQNQE